jgi:hypothetical protein
MRDDPVLHAVHTRMQVGAVIEVDAELLVLAIAAQVDDHLSRHPRHHDGPEVLLDQRQRHVDARGHARAGDDAAVLDEEAVFQHSRAGMASP